MALTCWYAVSGKNACTPGLGRPVTSAVHRSVISARNTVVRARGSALV